jgi:ATP-dependent Clp protease ATP-binding subunit ClpA
VNRIETIINSAVIRANALHHEYLTLECIFLSLLDDASVRSVLESCGANLKILEDDLNAFLANPSHYSVLSDEEIEELSKQHFADEELRKLARASGVYYQPEISMALQRVIQRAAIHVQSSGKKDIFGVNL